MDPSNMHPVSRGYQVNGRGNRRVPPPPSFVLPRHLDHHQRRAAYNHHIVSGHPHPHSFGQGPHHLQRHHHPAGNSRPPHNHHHHHDHRSSRRIAPARPGGNGATDQSQSVVSAHESVEESQTTNRVSPARMVEMCPHGGDLSSRDPVLQQQNFPNEGNERGNDSGMSSCTPSPPAEEIANPMTNPIRSATTERLENNRQNFPRNDTCHLGWQSLQTTNQYSTQAKHGIKLGPNERREAPRQRDHSQKPRHPPTRSPQAIPISNFAIGHWEPEGGAPAFDAQKVCDDVARSMVRLPTKSRRLPFDHNKVEHEKKLADNNRRDLSLVQSSGGRERRRSSDIPDRVCRECHRYRLEDKTFSKERFLDWEVVDGKWKMKSLVSPLEQPCIHYFFNDEKAMQDSSTFWQVSKKNLNRVADDLVKLGDPISKGCGNLTTAILLESDINNTFKVITFDPARKHWIWTRKPEELEHEECRAKMAAALQGGQQPDDVMASLVSPESLALLKFLPTE